jgi:exodeoxyribonuclease VII small subunit
MSKKQNFEESLNALESIVNQMEKGELSLEDSLKEYEKGMGLVRNCQKTLTDAEQRIKVIVEKNGDITETDLGD